MTLDEIKTTFLELPPGKRIYVLSLLAHNLTICARASYPSQIGVNEAVRKLTVFNELQHSISSQVANTLASNTSRYSDDLIIDILFEKAQQDDCQEDLIRAFNWSFSTKIGPSPFWCPPGERV